MTQDIQRRPRGNDPRTEVFFRKRTFASIWRAFLVIAIGGVLWLGAAMIVLSVPNLDTVFPTWGSYLVLPAAIGFIFCVVVGRELIQVGRRALAPSAYDLISQDRRNPVLYLRAFTEDARARETGDSGGMPYAPIATEEEQLAKATSVVGPFIAIGQPGEPLPELGAARFYTTEDKWKEAVAKAIEMSQLVLIHLGETPGVVWELEEAFRVQPPERIVLLIPFAAAEYERFRSTFSDRLPYRLPPWSAKSTITASIKAIVIFSTAGTSRFISLTKDWLHHNETKPLLPAMRLALRAVCDQLRLPWKAPPIAIRYWINSLWTGVFLVVLVMALASKCQEARLIGDGEEVRGAPANQSLEVRSVSLKL